MPYLYHNVELVRVLDGDTVELEIDLGNRIRWRDCFRLMGIDTPERNQPGYNEATRRLQELLSSGITYVETHKPDKFGRWLIDLFIAPQEGGTLHVNAIMILDGHAKSYYGGKKQ